MTHCQPDKKIIELNPMTGKRRTSTAERNSANDLLRKKKKKKTNSIRVQGEC